jgi:hypothetical protein
MRIVRDIAAAGAIICGVLWGLVVALWHEQ